MKDFLQFGCYLSVQGLSSTSAYYFVGKYTYKGQRTVVVRLFRFSYVCYAFGLLKEGMSLLHRTLLIIMSISCIHGAIIHPFRFPRLGVDRVMIVTFYNFSDMLFPDIMSVENIIPEVPATPNFLSCL